MGRKKRTHAVDKTTVYFLESDLNKIDAKNRRRALRIAKEVSLNAVSEFADKHEKNKGKDQKIWLFQLSKMNPDNVKETYEYNFNSWLLTNSSEKIDNGEKPLSKNDIPLLMLPETRGGQRKIHYFSVSRKTEKGTPLIEQMFIMEELRTYRPLYEKTIGSEINMQSNYILEYYIKYLENRLSKLPKYY